MKYVMIVVGILVVGGAVWYFVITENDAARWEAAEIELPDDFTSETGDADETPAAETDADEVSDSVGTDNESTTREFTIDSFMYGYSPDVIRVNEGDTVTITLTNSAGLHDWVVDEFDAASEIISSGEETTVTFVAHTAGEYEFYCSVGNHRAQGMVGTLIVE